MNTHKEMKKIYINFFISGGLPLYRNATENRGSTARCAFWNGFHGINKKYGTPGSRAYAAFQAGKFCAKTT